MINFQEKYNDIVETARIASSNPNLNTRSIVGSISSYSDALKNSAYLEMIEGRHLIDYKNVKKSLESLILSTIVFSLRNDSFVINKDFDIDDNEDIEVDFLFENCGKLSNEIFLIIMEEKNILNCELINNLIKFYILINIEEEKEGD